MNTTVIAFFNSQGKIGKTSLVYHLAWMYADLGLRVVQAVQGAYRDFQALARNIAERTQVPLV